MENGRGALCSAAWRRLLQMRPLTEEARCCSGILPGMTSLLPRLAAAMLSSGGATAQETKAVFEKLHKFLGKGIRHLVERSDEDYVLRLNRNRVYYVRESLMRRATNVRRPCLAGPGCAV